MTTSIEKLLAISSKSILEKNNLNESAFFSSHGSLGNELRDLLESRNGFYAFESALHVLPFGNSPEVMDIQTWNKSDLWINFYGNLCNDCLFFAEDLFGGQFCIRNNCINCFDPETGEFDQIADTLEEWAHVVLSDYEVLTAHPLAHDWQLKNGALPTGMRLVPKIPFVCGGSYTIDNLFALDAVKGMRFRGELALLIRDLPDGTRIRFNIIDRVNAENSE